MTCVDLVLERLAADPDPEDRPATCCFNWQTVSAGAVRGPAVPCFLVIDGPDVDFDRIRDSVVAELGELYQPRGVTIVPRLPLTKVGKVDKRELRSRFR